MRCAAAERGRLVIPRALRERLRLRPGQVLVLREDRGRLVATVSEVDDPVDAVYGILGRGRRTDDRIAGLRGKVDAV